ncbi:S-layer homology domain-containing protein [Lacrimispora sp.]|uniref:S-layer homology domain-containing protein n=1 Tax=Lacrimispora sp. TaxID=2719234 RepID=UPI00289B0F67|nr:S-layer homology domain-containing protein [Lacrimispora sp.]
MKHKKMSVRLLAYALSIAMVFNALPLNAFAVQDVHAGTSGGSESGSSQDAGSATPSEASPAEEVESTIPDEVIPVQGAESATPSEANPTGDTEETTPGEETPPQEVENATPSSAAPTPQLLAAPLFLPSDIITVGTSGADYTTVAAALRNAEDGATIQLITSINESVNMTVKKEIVFDLNGQTWTNTGSSVITVASENAITIKDSGVDGTISNTGTGAAIFCYKDVICTIKSGTIKAKKVGVLIQLGSLVLEGGNILAGLDPDNDTDTIGIYSMSGQIDVQGGYVQAVGKSARAIQNKKAPLLGIKSQVSMSEGMLTVNGDGAVTISIDAGDLDITGGSLYASPASSLSSCLVIDSLGTTAGKDVNINIADEVIISPEGRMEPKTSLYRQSVIFKAPVKSGSASFDLEDAVSDYNDYTGMRWIIYTSSDPFTPNHTITASSSGKIITLNGVEMNKTYYASAYDRSHGKGISGMYRYSLSTVGVNASHPIFTNNLSTDEVFYGMGATASALDATATADDGGTITYEWYKSIGSSTEGTKLNVTTATYTPPTSETGKVYYYCVATNTIEDNGDGGSKTAAITSKYAEITVVKSAAERLKEARELAEKVIEETKPTNDTDVLKIIEDVIVDIPGVTVRWKSDPEVIKATSKKQGTITGTIVLTCDTETVEVPINMIIQPQGLTVGDAGTGAEYATIEAALAEASDYNTIRLLSPVTEDVTVTGYKKVTIDLNGQTWMGAGGDYSVTVLQGGYLNIVDSKGGGIIENSTGGVPILGRGVCEITGGTVKGQTIGVELQRGVLTVNGGTVLAGQDDGSTVDVCAIYNKSGKVTILGGQIEAHGTNACAMRNEYTGKDYEISISDGELKAVGDNATVISLDSGYLEISGGKLRANPATAHGSSTVINAGDDAFVTIADKVAMSPEGEINPRTLTPEVEESTVTIKYAEAAYTLSNASSFENVKWRVYAAETGNDMAGVLATLSGTTLTLQGIAEEGGTYYVAAYDRANGKGISARLALTTIQPVKAKVPAISKDLSADEVTYANGEAAAALEVTATSEDGGTITYEWYKNAENNTDGGTKLNATTPTYVPPTDKSGTVYYYCVIANTISDNGDGGKKASTITTKIAKITVDKSAEEKLAEAKTLAEKAIKAIKPANDMDVLKIVEDAVISVKGVTPTWKDTPVIKKATRKEPGFITGTIVLTCDGKSVEVAANLAIPTLVLTVGAPGSGADYATVKEAVVAADSGDKIQLITDVSEYNVMVDGNKKLSIDLNGHTWKGSPTSGRMGTVDTIQIESGSTLTIKDSIGTGKIHNTYLNARTIFNLGTCNIESGIIESDGYFAIENRMTGVLNVNAGIITGSGSCVITSQGTVVINGGIISGTGENTNGIENDGSLTMNGGVLGIVNEEAKSVIVSGRSAKTKIADGVVLSPEGAMNPLTTKPLTDNATAPLVKNVASFTLKTAYGSDVKWIVYSTKTGDNLANGVTASSSGQTITLNGVREGTYYVAAYDRTNGKGISARLALTVGQPFDGAAAPIFNKDLSTEEVTYASGASAAALDATATASDGGTITYEWYMNTQNSTGGTILNVTTPTYTPSTAIGNTTYYYCMVTNTISRDGRSMRTYAVTRIAKITVVKKDNSNSNGSGGSSRGSDNNDSTNTNSGRPVIVDGKTQNIGAETKSATGTTVTVDTGRLSTNIDSAAAGSSVVVPVSQDNTVTAQFVVKNVVDMAAKNMILSVQTGKVVYNLNTAAIDTAALAAAFPGTDTTKIRFDVTIKNNPATNLSETLVLPPVEFVVTATYNKSTVSVDAFNAYIDRVIEVTKEQAAKIATAVVVNADGSTRHVPTEVYEKDGKFYAAIHSRTNSTYALIYNNVAFADAKGKWYEAAVNEMGSRKIITGDSNNNFAGDNNITRAEFTSILVRALGLPVDKTSTFDDISATDWYSGAVATAVQFGLVNRDDNNRFAPQDSITRQEAMLMLQRAAALTRFTGVSSTLDGFKDAKNVAPWAKNAMEWSVGSGLIDGSNGQLSPTQNMTRGESAAILLHLLQKAKLVDVRSKL